MKWWNRFGTGVLFAVVVACLYPIYESMAGPWIGRSLGFAAYVLFSAALYLIGIASQPTLGLAAASAIVTAGTLLLIAGASGSQLVLLTAVLVGVLRSGLLQVGEQGSPRNLVDGFGRRFAREVVFIGCGLALAAALANGSAFPEAFAIWGFYLAQSGFFLLGGRASRDRGDGSATPRANAFENAVKRAREVLAASGS